MPDAYKHDPFEPGGSDLTLTDELNSKFYRRLWFIASLPPERLMPLSIGLNVANLLIVFGWMLGTALFSLVGSARWLEIAGACIGSLMFSSLSLATLVIAFRAVADYRDFVRETGMAGVIGIPLHLFSIIIPALMLIYSLLVPFGAAGMIP